MTKSFIKTYIFLMVLSPVCFLGGAFCGVEIGMLIGGVKGAMVGGKIGIFVGGLALLMVICSPCLLAYRKRSQHAETAHVSSYCGTDEMPRQEKFMQWDLAWFGIPLLLYSLGWFYGGKFIALVVAALMLTSAAMFLWSYFKDDREVWGQGRILLVYAATSGLGALVYFVDWLGK